MNMVGTTDPIEMLTVSDENIAVEEQLSRKNGGWVITFTLTSRRDSPIAVRISVPMPDEPTRQDAGFHPKHEPQTWGIRDGILTFEDTVPSDEPLQILLGIVLVGDEDVSLSLAEPTIELSQPVDSVDEAALSKETPIFRSNSIGVESERPADPEAPTASVGPDRSDESATDDTDVGVETGSTTPEHEPADRDESDEAVSDSEGATGAPETATPADDDHDNSLEQAFDMDHLSEISEEIEEPPEDAVDDTGPVRDADSTYQDENIFGDFRSPRAADDSTDTEPSAKPVPEADRSDDVLSKLVEQLESSDPNPDDIEALREHLVPESQKSTNVRMQHIQSRMDDLAAYTEALEGLIDKHGTASEFMTTIETELQDLSTQIDAVRSETEAADDERQEIHERLVNFESSVEDVEDDLHARTETINEELDSIRDSVESQGKKVRNVREAVGDHDQELESLTGRIESVDDQMEDHRDALDQRLSTLTNQVADLQRTVESDFDQLQDEVESLAEMREVFARAFVGEDLEAEMNDVVAEDSTEDTDETE